MADIDAAAAMAAASGTPLPSPGPPPPSATLTRVDFLGRRVTSILPLASIVPPVHTLHPQVTFSDAGGRLYYVDVDNWPGGRGRGGDGGGGGEAGPAGSDAAARLLVLLTPTEGEGEGVEGGDAGPAGKAG